MNNTQLTIHFNTAINWNILLYIIYKTGFVIISYLLFSILPAQYFSQWALSNAVIFLSILWIDLGFKKSIPLFYPLFCQTAASHRFFTTCIIMVQSIILIITLYPYHKILTYVGITHYLHLYVFLLFITETLCNLFQNIYHAHFKNKFFNSLAIACTLCEIILNIYCITSNQYTPEQLLKILCLTKLLSSIGIIIGSILGLSRLKTTSLLHINVHTKTTSPSTQSALIKKFMLHSCVMWASNIIKSLTERNFLFPFFTNIYGIDTGNIFKLGNDSTLFFQRIALKSIGSSDTALLSYTQVAYPQEKHAITKALSHIFKSITYIIIFIIIASIILIATRMNSISSIILALFSIMTTGTIIEIILSPYERFLEVKCYYKKLWIAYTPYCIGITLLGVGLYYTIFSLSMLRVVCIIHILRIISSCLLAWQAKKVMRQYS